MKTNPIVGDIWQLNVKNAGQLAGFLVFRVVAITDQSVTVKAVGVGAKKDALEVRVAYDWFMANFIYPTRE